MAKDNHAIFNPQYGDPNVLDTLAWDDQQFLQDGLAKYLAQ